MADDDLRFGDANSGGGGSDGPDLPSSIEELISTIISLFVLVVVVYVLLSFVDSTYLNDAIPFLQLLA